MSMYLGLDLGGTNLKAGVLNQANELVWQTIQPTNARRPADEIVADMVRLVRAALEKYPETESVGIGVPGMVSHDGTVRIAPNIQSWKDLPLRSLIQKEVRVPVVVENDANVGAIAEMGIGAGAGVSHFIYVSLGTGVGGAIVINNCIYRGESGAAGEIGHVIVDIHKQINEARPFRTGVLEEFIGKNQVTYSASRILRRYKESTLLFQQKPDPYHISSAAEEGDAAALEVLETAGYYLGIALSSAMNLLDISLVVVGGGLSHSHHSMFDKALETIRERTLPPIAEIARIEKARFHKEAGIYGAALLGKNYLSNQTTARNR